MGDSTQPVNNSNRNTGVNRPNEKSRPSATPKSNKDFKKILNDHASDEEGRSGFVDDLDADSNQAEIVRGEEAEGYNIAENVVVPPKSKFSLFNLADTRGTSSSKKTESPFGLFSKGSAKRKDPEDEALLSSVSEDEAGTDVDADLGEIARKGKKPKLDDRDPAFGAVAEKHKQGGGGDSEGALGFGKGENRPDASYLNAGLAVQSEIVGRVSGEKEISRVDMQKIIDQLVDRVVEMRQDGRTDTMITLKEPPLFAGTTLVVTGFDSARGEFNLSFQNLTQAAKNLLDLQVNQDSLKLALQKVGYGVHIVVATTQIETPIVTEPSRPDTQRDQQRGQERENREGKGQQR